MRKAHDGWPLSDQVAGRAVRNGEHPVGGAVQTGQTRHAGADQHVVQCGIEQTRPEWRRHALAATGGTRSPMIRRSARACVRVG